LKKSDIGVIVKGKIGINLARNLVNNGYYVSLYNLNYKDEKYQKFVASNRNELFEFVYDFDAMTVSLTDNKIIFLVSENDEFPDEVYDVLLEKCNSQDIIVDFSDIGFEKSIGICKRFEKNAIAYLGAGMSGGAEAALNGPSFMPGGSIYAYDKVKEILENVAAQIDGVPCCSYIGPEGSGIYVKMIHDAIAYGMLQLLSESAYIIQTMLQCDNNELHDILSEWNTGELDSLLLDLTADITGRTDQNSDKALMNIVLDKVGYRKNAYLISTNAFELSVPIPVIIEAINARFMSNMKKERIASSKMIPSPQIKQIQVSERKDFIEKVRCSLYLGLICVYAQSFALLKKASIAYNWNIDMSLAARIFQGGSFIKSKMLFRVAEAFARKNDVDNLFVDVYFKSVADNYSANLREIAANSIINGLATPAIINSMSYIDNYRCAKMPVGIIQLARDFICNSGYERIDKQGLFHVDWNKDEK